MMNSENEDGDNLFDNLRNFFRRNMESGNKEQEIMSDVGDEVAGSTLIASIPVRSIKPGGLRLFLMFYLMGMQNTPDKNSWRPDQPSSEEYIVEMYYHDASGMLTIELLDDVIRISRCGSVPSTSYLMQETVIVQGILDELDQCAFDDTVEVDDRLLIPDPPNAIDMVRDTLSFA